MEFEKRFADYVGADHAVAVNSCTAALHLALAGLDIGPGDEVIVPTMTFAATAEVAIYMGATPVLVDCHPGTLNIDPAAAAAAVTPHTRAILPVHFAGHPAPLDPLLALAEEHELALIEDAAHALPARHRGRMIGTIGDVTCFSFYANKTITTGEGGMATTDDAELADRMRMLRLHGLSLDAWDRFGVAGSWEYDIVYAGYKYNLTDIAATLGIHQLARSDEFHRARASRAAAYTEAFAPIAEIEPLDVADDVQHAWHLYIVRLDLDRLTVDRNRVVELLRERGIGTSVHYKPLHLHRLYRERYGYAPGDFPNASAVYPNLLTLPLFPSMSDAQQRRVIDALGEVVAAHRR